MLTEEAALTAHNLLAPLLARPEPPALLRQPLAGLHLGLSRVVKLRAARQEGQGAQRVAAARAAAATACHLLRLLSGPAGGRGGVWGQAGAGSAAEGGGAQAGGLERHLAALDFDLLRALGSRPASAGLAAAGVADDGTSAAAGAAAMVAAAPAVEGGKGGKTSKPPTGKAKRGESPAKGKVGAVSEEGDALGAAGAGSAGNAPGGAAAAQGGECDDIGGKECGAAALSGPGGCEGAPELELAKAAVLAHPAGRALGGPVMERWVGAGAADRARADPFASI
jgi:hypothetical protein